MDKQQNELIKSYYRSRMLNNDSYLDFNEMEMLPKFFSPEKVKEWDMFVDDERRAEFYNEHIAKNNNYKELSEFNLLDEVRGNKFDAVAVATFHDDSKLVVDKNLKPSLKGLTFKLFIDDDTQFSTRAFIISNILRMKFYDDIEKNDEEFDGTEKHNIKSIDIDKNIIKVLTKDNKKFFLDDNFKIIKKNG